MVDNIAKEYILRFSVSSTFHIYPCIYSRVNSCVKSEMSDVLEELETEGEAAEKPPSASTLIPCLH